MNLDDLTLGQFKEIKTLLRNDECITKPTENHGVKLVVLDKGFVYIGQVTTDSIWCSITDARNIRYWGTTEGLGELCKGPTSKTRIDLAGNIKAPMSSLILLMAVEEGKWKD